MKGHFRNVMHFELSMSWQIIMASEFHNYAVYNASFMKWASSPRHKCSVLTMAGKRFVTSALPHVVTYNYLPYCYREVRARL
jgi:hypothetical protein